MRFEDSISLGAISGGPALQKAAVKLQSYAAINFRHGGTFGHTKLVEFWQDQLKRVDMTHGHPADGVYTGFGTVDIRKLCYHVQSHVRMYGTEADKQRLKQFIEQFINAAWSLDKARTKVASLVAVPIYDAVGGFSAAGQEVRFEVRFVDAAGKPVNASSDNPLIGTIAARLDNEAAPDMQGKWRKEMAVRNTPYTYSLAGISTQKPGPCVAKFRYTADAIPPLEVTVNYVRLDAGGNVPPTVPDVPAPKNGVTA